MRFICIALAGLLAACQSSVPEEIVGGERDAHGCIPSAGYQWSEEKQKCVRPWEEE